jgi:hypothetical protein
VQAAVRRFIADQTRAEPGYSGGMRSRTVLVLVALTVGLTACQQAGPPGAGRLSVPDADPSPPTVTLTAWTTAASGPRVAVRSGFPRRMPLRAKTGTVQLVATATDAESGVQAVELWVSKFSSFCSTATCTGGEPAVTAPRLVWAVPRRHPGQPTAPSGTLPGALDLTREIPQGPLAPGQARSVRLTIWAKASNNLGGTAETAKLVAHYDERA